MKNFAAISFLISMILPSLALAQNSSDTRDNVDEIKSKIDALPKKSLETFTGAGIMAPEIVPLEVMFRFKQRVLLRGYASPGVASFPLPLTISAYESRSTLFKVYSPPQEVDATVKYGPHFGLEGYIFPTKGRFYLGGGLGVRQITATIDDSLDFYICFANDSNCGTTSNPPQIRLSGSATSTSYLARAALGWLFQPTERSYINLIGIGISYPFSRSLSQNLNVTLENTGLPPWLNSSLTAGVNATLEPYEGEIAEALYDAYAREYDSKPLPISGVTAGIHF